MPLSFPMRVRAFLLPLILALAIAPAPAPLRLEASTARSECTAGDRFTIATHLFNDSTVLQDATIAIAAPPGFVPLGPESVAGTIAPGRATISWQSPTRACLSVTHATGQGVFIGCWPGAARVMLGHVGPLSGDLRPTSGDVYCVSGVGCAPLQGVTYLPAWR